MDLPFPREAVSEKLLAWYGRHGRDLPWRNTRDPYRIWLSEIMLQQTTVTTVIPYYERFLDAFPNVASLAAAPLENILELWAGLGYYSRARNLHRAAQQVVDELDGEFPATVEGLLRLPGIGRSTAGAIVSIAFDRPAPILDGNVRRVLVRLTALQQPPRERSAEKKLWTWAEMLTPDDRPHDYAQAIMDLGATVCAPKQPKCTVCPLAEICQARQKGMENELPVKAAKKKVPLRRQAVLVLRRNGQLLVRRRPPQGLLGGMWEFPWDEIRGVEDGMLPPDLARNHLGMKNSRFLGQIRHVYSHFRLEAEVFLADTAGPENVAESDAFWHDADKLLESPLHGAHRKVLELYLKEENNA